MTITTTLAHSAGKAGLFGGVLASGFFGYDLELVILAFCGALSALWLARRLKSREERTKRLDRLDLVGMFAVSFFIGLFGANSVADVIVGLLQSTISADIDYVHARNFISYLLAFGAIYAIFEDESPLKRWLGRKGDGE